LFTWVIKAECANGHAQEIKAQGEGIDQAWAEMCAGLLDGSSPLYRSPPGPESVIGKCGICRAQIECTVEAVS
jgi:hypothetical protein